MVKVRIKQEKQELANLFGQVAYGEVGAIARKYQRVAYDKLYEASCINNVEQKVMLIKDGKAILDAWGQGGTNKIILHALVGGIMAELAGHDFAIGAVAAGLNEALQKELGEWERENPVANEWVSLAIGAAVDRAMGSSSNIGAAVALAGTKYNWDHHAHNYIIDQLEFPPDDAALLKKIDTAYDESDSQFDPICHAMPVDETEHQYWTGHIWGVSKETVLDMYATKIEEWRLEIRNRCSMWLGAAIYHEIVSKNDYEAIKCLAIALHIVADDYAHRQANATLAAHGRPQIVPYEPYVTPRVDWMDLPENQERFSDALAAAKEVNGLYQDRKYLTTEEIQSKLDHLFPSVKF